MHIKGVWHTLYAMYGHMDATPTCMNISMTGLCVTSGNSPHCQVLIGTSYPLPTHVSGPLHTYKLCFAYFICSGWSYGCHSILYGHYHNWAVCHIRELTTLLGCDWYLISTSYTCQVHFIHINGVLHTLYAVDGHKDATPTCMAMPRARAQLCVTSGN